MTKPWVLAHISDFHVSTFGETFHDRAHFIKRSQKPFSFSTEKFEVKWEQHGWKILIERPQESKKKQKETWILLDPDGYEHTVPSEWKKIKNVNQQHPYPSLFEHTISYALSVEKRRAKTLAKQIPSLAEARKLLEETPNNTNVRFLIAAQFILNENPDLIFITGDMTDNGDGYELIEALFASYIEQGRLLAVPGNHDLYLFPFGGSVRPKATQESKRKAWLSFAQKLGITIHKTGAWTKEFPEYKTVFAGLDSCAMGQRRFMLHIGAIGKEQLHYLKEVAQTPSWKQAHHRFIGMHYHLAPLSYGIGKSTPTEIGMRLEDAKEVAQTLNQVQATFAMHGHRHISEARQPANCDFQILSAPSLTLGSYAGDPPSYWKVECSEYARWKRIRLPLIGIKETELGSGEAK